MVLSCALLPARPPAGGKRKSPRKPKQESKQADMRASKPAGKRAGKQASKQGRKQASKRASKRASNQEGGQASIRASKKASKQESKLGRWRQHAEYPVFFAIAHDLPSGAVQQHRCSVLKFAVSRLCAIARNAPCGHSGLRQLDGGQQRWHGTQALQVEYITDIALPLP